MTGFYRHKLTQKNELDTFIIACVIILICFGTVMIFSASAPLSSQRYGSEFRLLIKHLVAVLIGTGLAVFIYHVPLRIVRKFTVPLFILNLLLLLAVLVPGIGKSAGGARRWISLGFFNFQPSEFMKVVIILYLARTLSRKVNRIEGLTQVLPQVIMCLFPMALILKQPDFGTTVVIATVLIALLFITGTRLTYMIIGGLFMIPVVYYIIINSPYKLKRVIAFLDPWSFRYDSGYQVVESLMAFGLGGFSGVGLGASKQKMFFLPEAHTDFIFSIVGEELGFVGVVFIVLLMMFLFYRMIISAARSQSSYRMLIISGAAVLLITEFILNSLVCLGMLPTKGMVCPFMSYGGSSIMSTLFLIGIVLRARREEIKGEEME